MFIFKVIAVEGAASDYLSEKLPSLLPKSLFLWLGCLSLLSTHTGRAHIFLSKIKDQQRHKNTRNKKMWNKQWTDKEEEKGTNGKKKTIKQERKRKRRQSGQTFREWWGSLFLVPLSLSTSLMRVLIKVERRMGDVQQIYFYHFFDCECTLHYVNYVDVNLCICHQKQTKSNSDPKKGVHWSLSLLCLPLILNQGLPLFYQKY